MHFGTSYGAPIIFTLENKDYEPMNSGLTTGGETVVITGRNFGPIAVPQKSRIKATYGGKKGETEVRFLHQNAMLQLRIRKSDALVGKAQEHSNHGQLLWMNRKVFPPV